MGLLCAYTKGTPEPPGGEIVRDGKGNPTGLLLAKPNATIRYATIAKAPKLPVEYRLGRSEWRRQARAQSQARHEMQLRECLQYPRS
jgi:predicted amidohydrolase YtcJ